MYREEYLAPIPEAERGDMLKAYHKRLSSSDKEISLAAAKAWAKWEQVNFTSPLILLLTTHLKDGYIKIDRERRGRRRSGEG